MSLGDASGHWSDWERNDKLRLLGRLRGRRQVLQPFAGWEWGPWPKQQLLIDSVADATFFGGMAGPGKTQGGLGVLVHRALKYPGCRQAAFRWNYNDLSGPGGIIDELPGVAAGTGCVHRPGRDRFVFPNGSFIQYAYAPDTPQAFEDKFQGMQLHGALIDEAPQWPATWIEYTFSRMRGTDDGVPIRLYFTGNPGGRSGSWFLKNFVRPGRIAGIGAPFSPPCLKPENPMRFAFIPAVRADNPALDSGYEDRMDMLTGSARARQKDGDWEYGGGTFFPQWSEPLHVEPWSRDMVNPEWRKIGGFDWGHLHWSVGLYARVDPEGCVWVTHETGVRLAETEVIAQRMIGHADAPPMWFSGGDIHSFQRAREPGGPRMAEALAAAGMHTQSVMGGVTHIDGWAQLRAYLRPGVAADGGPLLRVCRETGRMLCEQMPDAVPKSTDTEKKEDNDCHPETGVGGDDAIFALMYLLLGLPPRWMHTVRPVPKADPHSPAALLEERMERERMDAEQGLVW